MITFHTNIDSTGYPLVAIDLGYSNKKPSCGVMHTRLKEPQSLTFGACVKEVTRLVEKHRTLVLVVEAVLSTYHDEHGNPAIRGAFQKGRGWYHGPGVATYAAAVRLLRTLRLAFSGNATAYLAEAFLSFKETRSSHSNDARIIFDSFWDTATEKLPDGTEPIQDFIEGVPQVRVFRLPI
jgi:hypothetical protein